MFHTHIHITHIHTYTYIYIFIIHICSLEKAGPWCLFLDPLFFIEPCWIEPKVDCHLQDFVCLSLRQECCNLCDVQSVNCWLLLLQEITDNNATKS